jgi:hypothetical protein
MKQYQYEIKLSANTKAEAEEKLTAACILLDKLSAIEITKLAHVVTHDPVKTRMAKLALGV